MKVLNILSIVVFLSLLLTVHSTKAADAVVTNTSAEPSAQPTDNSASSEMDNFEEGMLTPKNREELEKELDEKISNNYSVFYDPNSEGKDLLESLPKDIIGELSSSPDNYAVMYFEDATILIRLAAKEAPQTVKAFKELVNNGFYNRTDIFRIIPNYMIQGGDPSNSKYGVSVIPRKTEVNDLKFERGSIAMANNGKEFGEANQFFITFDSFDWLNGTSTIFGKVISGIDFLESLSGSITPEGDIALPIPILRVQLLSGKQDISESRKEQRSERRQMLEEELKKLDEEKSLEEQSKEKEISEQTQDDFNSTELDKIKAQIEANKLNSQAPKITNLEDIVNSVKKSEATESEDIKKPIVSQANPGQTVPK